MLKAGDQVSTGPDSKMELALPDGSLLRFAENTKFKVVGIDMDMSAGRRIAQVNVALGKTWAKVNKGLGVKPNIEVSCENAVAGVRGTVYRMNVEQDKSVLLRVYEGEVSVERRAAEEAEPARVRPRIGQPRKSRAVCDWRSDFCVDGAMDLYRQKHSEEIDRRPAVPSKPMSSEPCWGQGQLGLTGTNPYIKMVRPTSSRRAG